MKKLGIMTFHASHNNGSMLQALALQTVLEKKFSCIVEIINFSNEQQQNMYSVLPKADNYKRVIKNIIWMTNIRELKKQYESYIAFSNKYFKLSKDQYENSEELRSTDDTYDAIIAGSDQVWNVSCRDADDAYYLNFLKNTPKYAYAVSFGANNPFELDDGRVIHKTYVESFSKISVREMNAKKWVYEATGISAPVCLDPTMLLELSEWEEVVNIGKTPIINGKYIFYYCFSISEKIQKFLKWVSNMTNMPVYFMEAKEWTLKTCWKNKIHLIKSYGPDVYMNVVKYAEMFITTSFHGTAFATIYKKNFWYINDGHNDPSKDDRAISFLTQLGLMSRFKTIEELMLINLNEKPDFTMSEIHLKSMREDSFSYINSIIKELEYGK